LIYISSLEHKAVMKPKRAVLPKLNLDRLYPPAMPKIRARNITAAKTDFGRTDPGFKLCAVFYGAGLIR